MGRAGRSLRLQRGRKHDNAAAPTQRMSVCVLTLRKTKLTLTLVADLFNKSQEHGLYLTLLTLLFAYAYDARTTQGDPTPESPWTLVALTPALSALDAAPYVPEDEPSGQENMLADLEATFTQSYRRALAFPLWRSFALAEACRSDIVQILYGGVRGVVHALLEVKRILDAHEAYYVYSKIWVDDFCTWVQVHANDEGLRRLADRVSTMGMNKGMIGWELEELQVMANREKAASMTRASDSDDDSESD